MTGGLKKGVNVAAHTRHIFLGSAPPPWNSVGNFLIFLCRRHLVLYTLLLTAAFFIFLLSRHLRISCVPCLFRKSSISSLPGFSPLLPIPLLPVHIYKYSWPNSFLNMLLIHCRPVNSCSTVVFGYFGWWFVHVIFITIVLFIFFDKTGGSKVP